MELNRLHNRDMNDTHTKKWAGPKGPRPFIAVTNPHNPGEHGVFYDPEIAMDKGRMRKVGSFPTLSAAIKAAVILNKQSPSR